MQITHHTNGEGLPNYPQEPVQVKDVTVFVHDSGMLVEHDYSCPCCRKRHAVLDLSTGLMHPCWGCREDYELIKKDKRKWWQKLLGAKT